MRRNQKRGLSPVPCEDIGRLLKDEETRKACFDLRT